MPFKSDKQRKWMHANEPDMAKKWEKEESIDEANASVIRKKLLKQFGDDPLYKDFIIAKTPKEQKKALKTLKSIRGFNAVRLMQKYVKKLQGESINGKLQNLIKQELKINKLEAFKPKGISQWKKMVLLPKSKMYFDPTTQYFWLMGPGGEPDWEDDPIEPKDWDYKRTLSRLSSKDKSIIKKSLRGKGNWKEATTTSVVPPHDTPQAYSKSTQTAIDIDDEDDEKNESVNEGRKWTMYVDDKKIKTHASKRAAVIAYNKFIKDTDDWKEVSIQAESVNEATSSKDFFSGNKVTNSLPRATLSLLNSKLNKASEAIIKITDKYKKQGDIDELVKIWMRGLHLRLKKGGIKIESVNEVRLVGYDKTYLDNAKKRLKVPHEITNIEYNQTRYRGPHDKFVKIFYKLKWKPGTRLDTEEKYVSVFYDSPERLKMIGKTLKLKLKESVNEKVANPFSEHLRKAQDEIEYMISNGPTPDGDDGVYDKPNQAMKLLQIAQKSLGKIK